MKVDLSCPVELRSYELIADDAGNTRANIRLFNLDERRISALEAVAYWQEEAKGLSWALPFSIDHLRAEPGGFFGISLSTSALARPDHIEIIFSRVAFEDGSREWRAGNGMVIEIGELQPLTGQEQNLLFAAAGEDAVRFASAGRDLWHCVCGRDNPRERGTCARCGRASADVLPALTREVLTRGNARGEVDLPLDDMSLEERRERSREAAAAQAAVPKRPGVMLNALAGLTAAALLAVLLFLIKA